MSNREELLAKLAEYENRFGSGAQYARYESESVADEGVLGISAEWQDAIDIQEEHGGDEALFFSKEVYLAHLAKCSPGLVARDGLAAEDELLERLTAIEFKSEHLGEACGFLRQWLCVLSRHPTTACMDGPDLFYVLFALVLGAGDEDAAHGELTSVVASLEADRLMRLYCSRRHWLLRALVLVQVVGDEQLQRSAMSLVTCLMAENLSAVELKSLARMVVGAPGRAERELLSVMASARLHRRGPATFFDFNANMEHSGLRLPAISRWPASGWALAAWVWFDWQKADGKSHVSLLSAETAQARMAVRVAASRGGLRAQVVVKPKVDATVSASVRLEPRRWYFVAVSHSTSFWAKDTMAFYVDGQRVGHGALPYTKFAADPVESSVVGGGLHGRAGAVVLFSAALADEDVARLYAQRHEHAFLAKLRTPNQLLAFDPAAERLDRSQHLFADVAHAGGGRFARALEGVMAVPMSLLHRTLASIGGVGVVLTAIDALGYRVATLHLVRAPSEEAVLSLAAAIRLLHSCLRDTGLRDEMRAARAFEVLGFSLAHRVPPCVWESDAAVLPDLFDLGKAAVAADAGLAKQWWRAVLLNFDIWAHASVDVQRKVLSEVADCPPESYDAWVGDARLLGLLCTHYWYLPLARARMPEAVQRGGLSLQRCVPGEGEPWLPISTLRDLRHRVLRAYRTQLSASDDVPRRCKTLFAHLGYYVRDGLPVHEWEFVDVLQMLGTLPDVARRDAILLGLNDAAGGGAAFVDALIAMLFVVRAPLPREPADSFEPLLVWVLYTASMCLAKLAPPYNRLTSKQGVALKTGMQRFPLSLPVYRALVVMMLGLHGSVKPGEPALANVGSASKLPLIQHTAALQVLFEVVAAVPGLPEEDVEQSVDLDSSVLDASASVSARSFQRQLMKDVLLLVQRDANRECFGGSGESTSSASSAPNSRGTPIPSARWKGWILGTVAAHAADRSTFATAVDVLVTLLNARIDTPDFRYQLIETHALCNFFVERGVMQLDGLLAAVYLKLMGPLSMQVRTFRLDRAVGAPGAFAALSFAENLVHWVMHVEELVFYASAPEQLDPFLLGLRRDALGAWRDFELCHAAVDLCDVLAVQVGAILTAASEQIDSSTESQLQFSTRRAALEMRLQANLHKAEVRMLLATLHEAGGLTPETVAGSSVAFVRLKEFVAERVADLPEDVAGQVLRLSKAYIDAKQRDLTSETRQLEQTLKAFCARLKALQDADGTHDADGVAWRLFAVAFLFRALVPLRETPSALPTKYVMQAFSDAATGLRGYVERAYQALEAGGKLKVHHDEATGATVVDATREDDALLVVDVWVELQNVDAEQMVDYMAAGFQNPGEFPLRVQIGEAMRQVHSLAVSTRADVVDTLLRERERVVGNLEKMARVEARRGADFLQSSVARIWSVDADAAAARAASSRQADLDVERAVFVRWKHVVEASAHERGPCAVARGLDPASTVPAPYLWWEWKLDRSEPNDARMHPKLRRRYHHSVAPGAEDPAFALLPPGSFSRPVSGLPLALTFPQLATGANQPSTLDISSAEVAALIPPASVTWQAVGRCVRVHGSTTGVLAYTGAAASADAQRLMFVERRRGGGLSLRYDFALADVAAVLRRRGAAEASCIEVEVASKHKLYLFDLFTAETAARAQELLAKVAAASGAGSADGRARVTRHAMINEQATLKRVQRQWLRREIDNFTYLMHLNTLAGRSFSDLRNYPVFPWVLADYSSDSLDLADANTFRLLNQPIGLASPLDVPDANRQYGLSEDLPWPTAPLPSDAVLYLLARVEPFASAFVARHGGAQTNDAFLMQSVGDAFMRAAEGTPLTAHELVPELFYLPEALSSPDATAVPPVLLPPWARSPQHFVQCHREALESDYVSEHLHEWVDLLFGVRLHGDSACERCNVRPAALFADADGSSLALAGSSPDAVEQVVARCGGLAPRRLFDRPHQQRAPPRARPAGDSARMAAGGSAIVSISQPRRFSVREQAGLAWLQPSVGGKVLAALGSDGVASRLALSVDATKGDMVVDAGGPAVAQKGRGKQAAAQPRRPPSQTLAMLALPSTSAVSNVALVSGGGEKLALAYGGNADHSVCLVALGDAAEMSSFAAHQGMVTAVRSSESGRVLVSGSRDASVVVWEVVDAADSGAVSVLSGALPRMLFGRPSGKCGLGLRVVHRLSAHDVEVTTVAVDEHLGMVASGSTDGSVVLYDLKRGTFLQSVGGSARASVDHVCISRLGYVAAAYSNHRVLLVSTSGAAIAAVEQTEAPPPSLHAMTFNSAGNLLVTGGSHGLTIYTVPNLHPVASLDLKACGSPVQSLAVYPLDGHPGADTFFIGFSNGNIDTLRIFF